MSDHEESLREHVLYLLHGGGAHLNFDHAFDDIPESFRGAKVDWTSHTLWRLLEHLRICQWDILEFTRDPAHVSPEFPDGYWPETDAPPDANSWDESIASFHNDLQDMIDLIADPKSELFAPFPHGEGQTLLREALLVADHNAYHLGQVVLLRRCLGIWDD